MSCTNALVGERLHPAGVELVQGPLFVAFAGVLGVALASWIPSTLRAVVVGVVGLSQIQVPMVLWWGMGTGSWWFLPLVHDLDVVGGNGDQLVVEQVRVAAMGWRLVYLAGLVVVVAAVALARRRRDGGVAGMVAVGSLLVVAGGPLGGGDGGRVGRDGRGQPGLGRRAPAQVRAATRRWSPRVASSAGA